MKTFHTVAIAVLSALCAEACSQPTGSTAHEIKSTAPAAAAAPPTSYGQKIVIPGGVDPALKASADDAADALGKMTGKPFVVTTEPTDRAIVLLRTDSPAADPKDVARLKDQGQEPFVIRGLGDRLSITANSHAGLSNGLYFYLREIGCRWLLPNEHWTIIPQRQDIGLAIDKLVVPDLKMREFFGTGGFGPPSPVDPRLELRSRWDLWKRRNLFGGEFTLAGHTFEYFYATHKKELDAHPEYGMLIGGKRVPWSVRQKPCVSNPDFVKMYVQDRLALLRRYPSMFAVSVEPSDGAGACQCDKCRAIGNGSESDQTFYLANQVAKAVAKEFPGHYVSLYAYGEHAAVPSFALEPNVYVSVVPYGFQRTGLSGDELLAAWQKKASRMSIYDYWSLPDWAQDQPIFNYLAAPDRIRSWKALGIEGINNESTTGAGAMGLAWYVSSRVMWDLRADDKAVEEEFYRLGFGPAEVPMKRMLERWARNFMLTTNELGLSYRDMAEAHKLASDDPAVLARLSDYEQYLHYLRLLYELHNPAPGTMAERTHNFITYLWRVYPTAMVSAYRMQVLTLYRFAPSPELLKEFDPKNKDAPGWKSATPVGPEELAALMADGEAKYQPLPIELRSYSQNLVAPKNPSHPQGTFSPGISLAGDIKLEFEASPGVSDVPLQITVSYRPGSAGDRITAYGPGGARVFFQHLPADGVSRELHIPTEHPGRYTVEIFDQKAMFNLRVPAGVPLAMRWFISPIPSPRIYFYVPSGLKKGAFSTPGVTPLRLFNADGKPVKYETSGPLVVFDIPPGQDGRSWSLENYKSWIPVQMINLPAVFSFFPNTLLYPAGLTQPETDGR